MAEIEHQMMDSEDEDDDASVQSAVSNFSDFAEDEEVDYLALELLHHLPTEKADKLVKSLRAKEKAVQDLVTRNRSLLNSCKALDEENQTLTDRLKDAEEVASAKEAEPPAPAPAPAAQPGPAVDNSFFLQMERGKEEKILRLTHENQQLAAQVRRLAEGSKQMEEALMQAQKEMKKVQHQPQKEEKARAGGYRDLDEEERIYRELQGDSMSDMIMHKFQQKQAEHRLKIQAALQALLAEDISRIERWGSDVKGVLLAVDGLEGQLKHQLKEPKSSKKGKPASASLETKAGESKLPSSEEITALSAQLLDDFDSIRGLLEGVEKDQLGLEQTARAVCDSAEPAVVALDLEESLAVAETEAEWLREHNASWVERCQSLTLKPMVEVLMRTYSAVEVLLSRAPPGLIPPNVDDCLRETKLHMSELSEQLQAQIASVAQLQEDSAAMGRTVRALQAAQKSHKAELRRKVSDEMQRTSKSFEPSLESMRQGLRQQSQALAKARSAVSSTLEDLAAAARRSATSQATGSTAAPPGMEHVQDFIIGEIRQVRSMGKALVSNLEEGCKAVEKRMQKVMEVIVGEPAGNQGSQSRPAASGQSGTVGEKEGASAEGKKKRNKKKSTGGGGAAAGNAGAGSGGGDAADSQRRAEPVKAPASEPAAASPASKSGAGYPAKASADADAELRAEFQEACSSSPSGAAKAKKASSARQDKILAGTDLLQELQSLRSDTEAIEARMAERLQARAPQGEGGEGEDTGAAKPAAAAARRRKKMFV